MTLSKEQINFYQTHGYLTINDVINKNEFNELETTTQKWVDKSRTVTQNDEIFILEENHSAENPRLKRIKDPYKVDETYKKLVHNNNLLDIIEDLIGPNIRLQGTKLNMKASGGGQQVEWHTDWGHYPHRAAEVPGVSFCSRLRKCNGPQSGDRVLENQPRRPCMANNRVLRRHVHCDWCGCLGDSWACDQRFQSAIYRPPGCGRSDDHLGVDPDERALRQGGAHHQGSRTDVLDSRGSDDDSCVAPSWQ